MKNEDADKTNHSRNDSQRSILNRQFSRIIADGAIAAGRDGTDRFKNPFGSAAATVAVLSDMAREPENMLARELASPALGIIDATYNMIIQAQCSAVNNGYESQKDDAAIVLEQLEFALALIFRKLAPTVTVLAHFSKNADLLCGAIGHAIGDGEEAAKLIGRYENIFPNDSKEDDGSVQPQSFPDQFTWDAYQRLTVLDEMADKYPEYMKTATRQMNAWPMLRYRHTDSKNRFETLAERLELGRDYPLNTAKTARFRPDTAMVRYLDLVVWRFHAFRTSYPRMVNNTKDEIKAIERAWKTMNEMKFDHALVPILQASISLSALTTATVKQWAEKAIVPYILHTDAKTSETCVEPALTKIWRQHRMGKTGYVKSISDFRSRLSPDVVKTLKAMARPVAAT